MEKKRVALKIAYNGAAFYGFAPQMDVQTVVGSLVEVLASLGIEALILAAGRTDRGVHATGQIISFEVPVFWDLSRLKTLLNQKLYPHIYVKWIWHVDEGFHPRFDALMREYRYIFTPRLKNIFLSDFISKERVGDIKKLRQALSLFIGEHNFEFFCKTGSDAKSNIRRIYNVRFYSYGILNETVFIVNFLGNGFLYSQIRLIMGAVLAYSRGDINLSDIQNQLELKERSYAIPVSPNGLYLSKVFYEQGKLLGGL